MSSNNVLNTVSTNEVECLFGVIDIFYHYDSHSPGKVMCTAFDQYLNTCLQGSCNLETLRIDVLRISRGSLPHKFKSYTKSILEHLITKFSFEPDLIKFHDVREKRFLDFVNDKSYGPINLDEIERQHVQSIPFMRALDELGYRNLILGSFDKDNSEEFYRIKYLEGRK